MLTPTVCSKFLEKKNNFDFNVDSLKLEKKTVILMHNIVTK